MAKFQCSNCGHVDDVDSLHGLTNDEVTDMLVSHHGEPIPAGTCPKCGTWCDADPTPEQRAAQLARDAAPDMLAALKGAQRAIDTLFARLIELDATFRPSKTPEWPAIVAVSEAIAKAEGETLEAMSEEWAIWCRAEGLECVDAQEYLVNPNLTPEQRRFAHEFCERWERIERKGPSGV